MKVKFRLTLVQDFYMGFLYMFLIILFFFAGLTLICHVIGILGTSNLL